jgi:guanylate kinase
MPFPVILSSPSGGGKTTIAHQLLASRDDVGYSVSCTTRPPRDGELDGRDYHFKSVEAFRRGQAAGEFAESAEVHGHLYGTLRAEVDRVLSQGKHVIMDIDVQGTKQFFAVFPESVLIFILPPSAKALVERLTARGTEDPRFVSVRRGQRSNRFGGGCDIQHNRRGRRQALPEPTLPGYTSEGARGRNSARD